MSKGGPERTGYFRAVAFGVLAFIGAYAAESIVKEVNNTPRDSAPFWCPDNVRLAYAPKNLSFKESVEEMADTGIRDFVIYMIDPDHFKIDSAMKSLESFAGRYPGGLRFRIGKDNPNFTSGQVINCRRAVTYYTNTI